MKSCVKCKATIPTKMIIDGKQRNLKNRKYCLQCSPFGLHNTKQIDDKNFLGLSFEERTKKRRSINVVAYRQRLKWRLVEAKGGKCERCKYDKKIPGVYSFHHRNPRDKNFTVATHNFGKGWKVLLEEVEKCDLLCCNCHAEVHHELYLESKTR